MANNKMVVKWIKIVVDIFDDEKILMIEQLPSGDTLLVIWFKLLCLAGKMNNGGVFLLNDKIAYTDEMLAAVFRRDITTVKLALDTFEKFEMIVRCDDVISLSKWSKHQSLDSKEKKLLYDREYRKNERENLKIEEKSYKSRTTNYDTSHDSRNEVVKKSCEVVALDIDIRNKNIDKDIDKDIDRDIDIYNNNLLRSTDVQKVVDAWNSLPTTITKVKVIKPNTERYRSLKARINDYGLESVLEAIENIRHSSFLLNGSSTGWKLDFAWFVLPNNFIKVLEGKYTDKKSQPTIVGTREVVEDDEPGIDLWGDDDENVIDYSLESNKND